MIPPFNVVRCKTDVVCYFADPRLQARFARGINPQNWFCIVRFPVRCTHFLHAIVLLSGKKFLSPITTQKKVCVSDVRVSFFFNYSIWEGDSVAKFNPISSKCNDRWMREEKVFSRSIFQLNFLNKFTSWTAERKKKGNNGVWIHNPVVSVRISFSFKVWPQQPNNCTGLFFWSWVISCHSTEFVTRWRKIRNQVKVK